MIDIFDKKLSIFSSGSGCLTTGLIWNSIGPMFKILPALLLFFSPFLHSAESPKILILVVASDNLPVYHELQKGWRSYMRSDPEHIEAYFVKANPNLLAPVEIKDDTIWVRTSAEASHILHKTISALEFLLERINNEFNYVIRTNLSTFYIYPRLLDFCKTLPPAGCYCGDNTGGDSIIGSGAGIIFSSDVIDFLVESKAQYINTRDSVDDCVIGFFLKKYNILLNRHYKINIESLSDWHHYKHNFPDNIFQVRVKTNTADEYGRLPNDMTVYSGLCDMFYNSDKNEEHPGK